MKKIIQAKKNLLGLAIIGVFLLIWTIISSNYNAMISVEDIKINTQISDDNDTKTTPYVQEQKVLEILDKNGLVRGKNIQEINLEDIEKKILI